MNKAKIALTVGKLTGRTGLILRKYSPEILTAAGVVSVVTAGILACKATLKLEETLDDVQFELTNERPRILKVVENGTVEEEADFVYKRRMAKVYAKAGYKFVRLYGPSVSLGLTGIGCLLGAHGIMRKRNLALIAAYKTIEEGFNNYRKRVIDEYGEEKEFAIKHGLHEEKEVTKEVGEDGKTKKVTTTRMKADPNQISPYARFYEAGCREWEKNAEYNLLFLKAQQNYFNQMLQAQGHVFLNEVYDALGIPRTQAGAVVGWIRKKDSDNYVDFGLYDLNSGRRNEDFINGYEYSILLDFNVDGVIYDLL